MGEGNTFVIVVILLSFGDTVLGLFYGVGFCVSVVTELAVRGPRAVDKWLSSVTCLPVCGRCVYFGT